LHLIPIQHTGDLNFANATPADQNELAEIAQKITKKLSD